MGKQERLAHFIKAYTNGMRQRHAILRDLYTEKRKIDGQFDQPFINQDQAERLRELIGSPTTLFGPSRRKKDTILRNLTKVAKGMDALQRHKKLFVPLEMSNFKGGIAATAIKMQAWYARNVGQRGVRRKIAELVETYEMQLRMLGSGDSINHKGYIALVHQEWGLHKDLLLEIESLSPEIRSILPEIESLKKYVGIDPKKILPKLKPRQINAIFAFGKTLRAMLFILAFTGCEIYIEDGTIYYTLTDLEKALLFAGSMVFFMSAILIIVGKYGYGMDD